MIDEADRKILSRIRADSSAAWDGALGDAGRVALLDFPNHMNVGDTMILAGELSYLNRRGDSIEFVSDLRRFDGALLDRMSPDSTLLMHGGGNFGDVWPVFQAAREDVVRDFPDRKIVQLPQTVYYQSPENAKRANDILGSHPDYTLMVRDTPSWNRAQELLPDVHIVFCPDAAYGWEPSGIPTPVDPARVVVLARNDREGSSNIGPAIAPLLGPRDVVVDWGIVGPARAGWIAAKVPSRITNLVPALRRDPLYHRVLERGWRYMLDTNLASGTGIFAGAQLVITDRLHAHVLANLMGIPSIVLDNSYGKVSSIFNDYSGEFSTARFVDSTDAALQAYTEWTATA